MADQKQNAGKAWVYPLFHFHFCRLTLLQNAHQKFLPELCLTTSKEDTNGNLLFGIANASEMHDYLDMVLASDQLVLDPNVRRQIENAGLFYQQVMQYRNQINHASDNSFGLQSERILPLDVEHIRLTLQAVVNYLMQLAPMKPVVPAGVRAIPVTEILPV